MFERNYLNYIIFFILSFLIIFGYATLFAPKPGKKKSIDQKEQTNVVDAVPTPSIQDIAIEEYVAPIVPLGKVITVRSPLFTGKIDTVGGRIIEWNLENYRETTSKDSPPVNLFKDSPPSYNSSLRLQGFQVPNLIPYDHDGDSDIVIDQKEQELRLFWKSTEGIELLNIFTFNPKTYLVEQRFEVINNTDSQITDNLSIEWFGRIEQEGMYKTNHDFRAMVSDKIENLDNPPKEALGFNGIINWFGFSSKYFLSAFLPEIGDETKLTVNSVGGNHLAKVTYTYPSSVVPSNNTSIRKSKLYLGPVEYEVLNTIGSGLQEAINYGWFGVLARPVGLFLKYINDYMHNYGISIIVITVIIRLLFLPLTIKSMGSMKEMQTKMQEIKPKIDALKDKFKDDKAKQNSELMKLYSSHGINPLSSLSGCLPLLIQLPVF
ncbi:MAG: membrane protein insertase YidC, partial [Thermodesulfobacteriota bacterium]